MKPCTLGHIHLGKLSDWGLRGQSFESTMLFKPSIIASIPAFCFSIFFYLCEGRRQKDVPSSKGLFEDHWATGG